MSQSTSRASWTSWGLAALALALAATHCAAIYTESINWDEFGLFHRTEETIRTGALIGAGRPGLGTVLMMPLVRDCHDAIAVAHTARWLTAFATFAFLAGLYNLLLALFRGVRERPDLDAAFGVALLACVPVFMRWSVQTRTDQWALACGVWGGVALLRSQHRPRFAWFAGVLFGIGWLLTQKIAYVLALVGLLAAGRQFVTPDLDRRREARRLAICALAGCAIVAGYQWWTTNAFHPRVLTIDPDRDVDAYTFYRQFVGYRIYAGISRSLGPHLVLAMLLIAASVRCREARHRRQLVLAWAVLALGLVVGIIHPSAFPYFWMTLGLFPAIAGALALDPIRHLFSHPLMRNVLVGALWLALLTPTIPVALTMSQDTQRIQREALAFVDRNFAPTARGFHPEGALFCRRDRDPFPIYFTPHIAGRFSREGAAQTFIASFVDRPVSFILTSHRLPQFPEAVRSFWDQHYILYGPGVLIPGFLIRERDQNPRSITTLVAGKYRWRAQPTSARAEIDGTIVRNGESIPLSVGAHTLRALDPVDLGLFAYAVATPPAPEFAFYPPSILRELDFGF